MNATDFAVLDAQVPGAPYLDALQPAVVRHFDLMATSPGGVAQLRDLILTLAVHGKLVPQDLGDEPAHVLLERIRADKSRLVAEGIVKRNKSLPEIAPEELPVELPRTWMWVRFGELLDFQGGGQPPKSHFLEVKKPGYVQLIQIRDLGSRPQPVYIPSDLASKFCTADDIMVGRYGASVGKVFWGKDGAYNVALVKMVDVHDAFDKRFLFELLNSPEGQALFAGISRSAQDGFNKGDIERKLIPYAPKGEQARIVARVDELMRLCDALEAKGRLEAEQHARLLGTLLGTLTDSSTPDELAANWQRVADHFDLLLDRPEAVDALEQTILQLAVRGLLVPQDPSEEPATVLIEQIRAARAGQLADPSRRKARAELPDVEPDEWPFESPLGWAWTRFGEVAQVSGGVTLGRKGAIASPVLRPYLRVANVQRWKLALDSMKDIVIDEAELPRYQLAEGDLLITEGGDWDKVGRTAIWRSELTECLHQNHVFKARGYTTTWNPRWAELYLNLDVARAYFAASAKQTTNLASINMTELRHCVFPLPPLNEQARIITRVTELRRVCAELRQRLAASQTTQSHLAQALVDEVA